MNRTIDDIVAHEKRLKEMLLSFNDNEKLDFIYQLLNKNIDVMQEGYDANFTIEYERQQEDIEIFLDVLKKEKQVK